MSEINVIINSKMIKLFYYISQALDTISESAVSGRPASF